MIETNKSIEEAFQDVFCTNKRGAEDRRDYYGLEVTSSHPEQGLIKVALTFKADKDYCCFEPGCHFSENRGIPRLRQAMTRRGVPEFSKIIIEADCHVEAGAIFGKYDESGPFRGGCKSEDYRFAYIWKQSENREKIGGQ